MFRRLTTKLAVYLLGNTKLEQKERIVLFSAITSLFKEGYVTKMERDQYFGTLLDLAKNKLLSNEEKQILTAFLLDKLGALPLHARITVDGTGKVFVQGRSLDIEAADRLKQAAVAMQNNAARNLVREAVTFMAIVDGVHKNITPEMGLFAKAALWFLQEEDDLYKRLAADGIEDDE